ncbi:hypothetical protein WICMUC_001472 [Wickerhamomyces mucosus]|uniref:Uncharacterized protein n=1 Tax=Wickerhamomyces mucosus TaxID=1378264 RepID=A0A9P8TH50_9ASCO|nr:hypothetical protein WICMUC_001472 [Wickerhamomyces mucosus]
MTGSSVLQNVLSITRRDPRIDKFLRYTEPTRKKINLNKLFIDPHINKKNSRINSIDFAKVPSKELRDSLNKIINNVKLINYKGLGKKSYFLPNTITNETLRKYQYEQTLHDYKENLDKNSICFIINDVGGFRTSVNYNNQVKSNILELSTSIQFMDPDLLLFKDAIKHDDKLYKVLEALPSNSRLRAIFLPVHSIDKVNDVLKIAQKSSNIYKPLGIYLNLQKSTQITVELLDILNQSELQNSSPSNNFKEMNYESLLKIAIESHNINQNDSLTRRLLINLGGDNFLNVNVTKKSISFIKNG